MSWVGFDTPEAAAKNELVWISELIQSCNVWRSEWNDDKVKDCSDAICRHFHRITQLGYTFKRLEPVYDYYYKICENG